MIRFILAFTALTAPAYADSPFVGHWGADAAQCTLAGSLDEDRPVEIEENALFAHEWSCDFVTLEILPGRAWKVAHTCLDMGFVEKYDEVWVLDSFDQLISYAEDGSPITLQRCNVAE